MIPAPADVTAPPAEAITTASGLAYRVLQGASTSEKPGPADKVTVHYTGWTAATGEMFDSSVVRGAPTTFGLNQVIPGWTEGVQLLSPGQKARFWIPGELAYGNTPQGGRPYGLLVFDVELLSFKAGPKAPPVPEDVAAPPADATVTASGLAYKVLQPGRGTDHPTARSTVTVHYTGWMTNGELFDSSVLRDEKISFGLHQVIPGWTEGLQLMVAGEKTRFWIPGKLAYGDRPSRAGMPYGMLVFDVELFMFR
ncbi:MAG: FKBP-type peptidyl-prolyl cis-trans isomerase [Deltaproteobacteria bacterium]|nr:FKBP-type peptidyl-prolyl cis-trans isomerase [Deltaproteobacteria bacterium]